MQTPTRLNKINPKLSGSRRQPLTYSQKHKNKGKTSSNSNLFNMPYLQDSFNSRISSRGQRIIEIMNNGGDSDTIKIQQDILEYQMMTKQFSQTEDLWNTQIQQTKNQLNYLEENIKFQQKIMRDMEKQLSTRRSKIINLQDKYRKVQEQLRRTPIQNFDKEIQLLSQQYSKIEQMGKIQLKMAQAEQQELLQQKQEIDEDLQALEKQIYDLQLYQMDNFNTKLSELLEQQSQLKDNIIKFQSQIQKIKNNLQNIQMNRPIKEELHRKYLQLYEKIFINKELDSAEALINYKDEQIMRLQEYGNRKILYRTKRKEIEDIQMKIIGKKNILTNLEHQIRDKSTALLDLYQMEALKSK